MHLHTIVMATIINSTTITNTTSTIIITTITTLKNTVSDTSDFALYATTLEANKSTHIANHVYINKHKKKVLKKRNTCYPFTSSTLKNIVFDTLSFALYVTTLKANRPTYV